MVLQLYPKYISAGLNTALSIAFAPTLAVTLTGGLRPYLYPNCIPLPTRGKPPPTNVPSCPYFILFLNVAAAFFLPVKPSVDSGSKKKDSLPGSDAIKSVAPTIVAPSTALEAILLTFLVLLPFIFDYMLFNFCYFWYSINNTLYDCSRYSKLSH